MSWKNEYKQKLMSAAEALSHVKSGNRVVVAHNCAEPRYLVQTLVDRHEELRDVEVMHILSLNKCLYAMEKYEKSFIHHTITYLSPAVRAAKREDFVEYSPVYFHQVPKFLSSLKGGVDVTLIQVSPPDEKGMCSFGVSCDYTKRAAEISQIVIAQVNKNMPLVLGDNFISVKDIAYIVEQDEDLVELKPSIPTEVEKKIGFYCASLVEDGSTLQLGVGALPDAVAGFLTEKNDLGIHSEMIADRSMDLILNGNINNSRKTLEKGKCVVSFLMGTRKFYDFVDNNPIISMHPVDFTNNPYIIAQNYKPVSINSALQIDLYGQVNAESIGSIQYTGTGGQVDFVRGVAMAEKGRSIIALPSTAKGESLSRIALHLDYGSAVSTSRYEVDTIVTEYGIAQLKGKTLHERAKALTAIAHPKFRSTLEASYLEETGRAL